MHFPTKLTVLLHQGVTGGAYLLLWRGKCHGGLVHEGLGAVIEEPPAAHQGERGWHFLEEGDGLTPGFSKQLHSIYLCGTGTHIHTKRIKG